MQHWMLMESWPALTLVRLNIDSVILAMILTLRWQICGMRPITIYLQLFQLQNYIQTIL